MKAITLPAHVEAISNDTPEQPISDRTNTMSSQQIKVMPINEESVLRLDDYLVWCGSVVRGIDHTYHMLFSMWARHKGHEAWVTDSMVGHAVSAAPLGPYRFDHVALRGSGQADGWDRDVIHNPTVKKFGNRYYMYYTGNFGNGEYWSHRNCQRIGCAISDDPAGAWRRSDQPCWTLTRMVGIAC